MNKAGLSPRFTNRARKFRIPHSAITNPYPQNHPIMNPIRILASAAIAVSFVSCASQQADEYDTPNPYGSPDASVAAQPPVNPIYDTPAAYEEGASNPATGVAAMDPGAPADPAAVIPSSPAIPSTPAAPANPNGAAIIHTVVKGDTLSGISAKYKVPIASIKAANRMTNDTVVLDRKMVIPPQ
jgi:LysM repeat protein